VNFIIAKNSLACSEEVFMQLHVVTGW